MKLILSGAILYIICRKYETNQAIRRNFAQIIKKKAKLETKSRRYQTTFQPTSNSRSFIDKILYIQKNWRGSSII